MSENQDANMDNVVAITDEMQSIVRRAAEPWAPGDSVKGALHRAARRTGIQFRRVRTFWYRQTEAISAVEADTLRAWHQQWIASQRERLTAELKQLEQEWAGGNE